VPILCEPATSSGRLLYTIGGDVQAVDSLTEAARLLDRDPSEFLVVIGPKAPTNEALAASGGTGGRPGGRRRRACGRLPTVLRGVATHGR